MITQTEILPPVLDACCSIRAFWFNKNDPRAVVNTSDLIEVLERKGYEVVVAEDKS